MSYNSAIAIYCMMFSCDSNLKYNFIKKQLIFELPLTDKLKKQK